MRCALEGDETKPPAVKNPRATSGDTASEPNWAEKLVITVGPKDADINGGTDKAIQAGVDYVARLGGGTVKILPGTYRLRNSIFLASKVRLLGSGWDNTILFKEPSVTTKLAADSDWYDQEITLADATGFQVGDGICLKGKGAGQVEHYVKRTLVARNGKRFKLDRALRENFWQLNGAVAMSVFPLVTGENLSDVAIENLTLDGNKANNDNLDGNYAGCIFLQDCSRVAIRRVMARNYNGDGISWQICHDVLVENCTSTNNAQLGLHPGSGSQRPIIRDNRLVGNDIGIFFCWGVKHGLAEKNTIEGNRLGISIGHRDTDNLITRQRHLRQQGRGHSLPPRTRQGFRRASQSHRQEQAHRQRRPARRRHRHSGGDRRDQHPRQRDHRDARPGRARGRPHGPADTRHRSQGQHDSRFLKGDGEIDIGHWALGIRVRS